MHAVKATPESRDLCTPTARASLTSGRRWQQLLLITQLVLPFPPLLMPLSVLLLLPLLLVLSVLLPLPLPCRDYCRCCQAAVAVVNAEPGPQRLR